MVCVRAHMYERETHRGLCHNEKGYHATCSNMDGFWEHHAKWNKSYRERQILYDKN